MKAICDARGWSYGAGATVAPLVQLLCDKGLIPAWLQNELTGIRTILEGGLGTVRNKLGGHGDGSKPRDVPAHFVAFALHMAAANIVLLVEAHRAMP